MTTSQLRTVRRSATALRFVALLGVVMLIVGVVLEAGTIAEVISSAVGGAVGLALAVTTRTPS